MIIIKLLKFYIIDLLVIFLKNIKIIWNYYFFIISVIIIWRKKIKNNNNL